LGTLWNSFAPHDRYGKPEPAIPDIDIVAQRCPTFNVVIRSALFLIPGKLLGMDIN